MFQSTQSLHCESAIVPVSVHSDSANGNILLLTNIVYVINKKKRCHHLVLIDRLMMTLVFFFFFFFFFSLPCSHFFMRSARIFWPLPLEAAVLSVLHMRMY